MKDYKGTVSENQEQFLAAVEAQGYRTAVCYGADEWTLDAAAYRAAALAVGFKIGVGRQHLLAADGANFPGHRPHASQARVANR